jgi:hypothetical protein
VIDMTIAERAERLGISVADFADLRDVWVTLGKPPPTRREPARRPASRALPFTQAQVRRAVKAVESAGKRVNRVTVNRDGSVVIDSIDGAPLAVDNRDKALAASWDGA